LKGEHVIPFFRQVMNDIAIGEKKNMNLPGVKVDLPVLQESGGPGQVFAPECSL
jgi:pyruvate kinase